MGLQKSRRGKAVLIVMVHAVTEERSEQRSLTNAKQVTAKAKLYWSLRFRRALCEGGIGAQSFATLFK